MRTDKQDSSHDPDGFHHDHRNRHSRVETRHASAPTPSTRKAWKANSQSAGDTEEDPNINHQAEAERQGDVQQDNGAESRGSIRRGLIAAIVGSDVGDLGAGKSKAGNVSKQGDQKTKERHNIQQEHGRAHELTHRCNEIWQDISKPKHGQGNIYTHGL